MEKPLLNLADYGLMTAAEVAKLKNVSLRTVGTWVAKGYLAAVDLGQDNRRFLLLDAAEVRAFTPPPAGRPVQD